MIVLASIVIALLLLGVPLAIIKWRSHRRYPPYDTL